MTNNLQTTNNVIDTPIIRRKFQLTSFETNNNKEWLIEWYADGRMVTTWGRTMKTKQTKTKLGMSQYDALKLIDEKIRKGYHEIELHVPTVVVAALPSGDPATASITPVETVSATVQELIEMVFSESGQNISRTLAVGINELSQAQIQKGLRLLVQAQQQEKAKQKQDLVQTVRTYYNTIPTQLPHKIDPDQVIIDFIHQMPDTEDYLHSLEAALATHNVTKVDNTLITQYHALGCKISDLPTSHENYDKIVDYVRTTIGRAASHRIRRIYKIRIPGERQAWQEDDYGKENVVHLFHGTHNKNLRHIFRTGLIVPKVYSNGRRMGNGIYFADTAARSINYTGRMSNHVPVTMFLADVAIGNPCKMTGSNEKLDTAPTGYHSVWGTGSWSNYDEFIVYRLPQQTLRTVILFE